VLAKLEYFTKSLFTGDDAPLPDEDEELHNDEDEGEVDDNCWKNHTLRFKPEKKVKDPNRMEEGDRYTTFDPLLLSKVKPMSQHKRRLAGDKKMEEW
jgi:hypothetical protein